MNRIVEYYETYDEEGRLSKDKAYKLEFITTAHFLEKNIGKDDRILDVGAGTGEYSLYFAEKGCQVTALDLSPKHVKIIKEKSMMRNVPINVMDKLNVHI